MILRRTDEGAEKCALRDLRREEETSVARKHILIHLYVESSESPSQHPARNSARKNGILTSPGQVDVLHTRVVLHFQ